MGKTSGGSSCDRGEGGAGGRPADGGVFSDNAGPGCGGPRRRSCVWSCEAGTLLGTAVLAGCWLVPAGTLLALTAASSIWEVLTRSSSRPALEPGASAAWESGRRLPGATCASLSAPHPSSSVSSLTCGEPAIVSGGAVHNAH